MPGPGIFSPLTVDARHGHDPGQFRWDWLDGHGMRHGVPGGRHAFARFGRLFTNGTAGIVRRQLTETVPVNGVSAGHFVRGPTRTEQILLTHRTIAPVLASLAIVRFVQTPVDAHTTLVAVFEIVSTTDATKTTIGTVVR